MPNTDFAVCTIISKNYLSYARVLADSVHRHHPQAKVFVLLVDRLDGYFAPALEPFELIPLEHLAIPDLTRFCFKYSLLELNTAVKPTLLRHLLRDRGVATLFYLDPDIVVYRALEPLRRILEHASIVMTPHLTEPLPDDGRKPSDTDILLSGAYNLGFIGLRNDETVFRFLDWWETHVYDGCIVDPSAGFFVDQRWMDLTPTLFPGVEVVKDPGYNVAYWNLPHRHLQGHEEDLSVNGQPLYFFHFSGVDLTRLDGVSRHQNRLSLKGRPDVRPLFKSYRRRQIRAGWRKTSNWPYAYASFDNDEGIPTVARRLYHRMGADVARFGNPFETAGADSFWRWLLRWAAEEVVPGSRITNLWYEVYRTRPDLQRAFPQIFGVDLAPFHAWVQGMGGRALAIPEALDPDAPTLPALERHAHPGKNRDRDQVFRDGVNVVGYVRSEKGVGEALRSNVRALRAVGMPHQIIEFIDPTSVNLDTTLDATPRSDRSYSVNLLHVNADQLAHVAAQKGHTFFENRYNIGYWMWELPEFPEVYYDRFAYVDEVWVGSTYCLDTIAQVSPVPVVKIPLALPAGDLPTKGVGRGHFGLPDGSFVFLFIFDVHSVVARKNPEAVIDAFRLAFPGREDVRLVLKYSHGDDAFRQTLLAHARDPRVVLIDTVLDRLELNSLIEACDCYVSLHRSEGFGITMAEAMTFAKPVIATGYSGNVDFMDAANSFPVRFDLVTLAQDYGPYRRGSTWAQPDIKHAAEQMRLVFESPHLVRDRALRGQQDIRRYLDPAAIGRRIEERLELIHRRVAAGQFGAPSPFDASSYFRNADLLPLPVPQATSTRPLVGRTISLMKRAARRSVSWYVTPQLNALQSALALLRGHVTMTSRHNRHQLNRVARRLGYIEGGVSESRSRLADLENRLAEVERKVDLDSPSPEGP
jgi:glycosyltransferase involved in cell wall biosynthesis